MVYSLIPDQQLSWIMSHSKIAKLLVAMAVVAAVTPTAVAVVVELGEMVRDQLTVVVVVVVLVATAVFRLLEIQAWVAVALMATAVPR